MAENVMHIQGVNFELGESREYIARKIAKIWDFVPRKVRNLVRADVRVEREGRWFYTLVTVKLPGKVLFVRDKSTNIHAAIDQAEAKIRGKIRRYKTQKNRHFVR